MGITGVILARNEERNIVECITALKPCVDEILLIDMESSDRTVELATPLVEKVLPHPLISNFDTARNIAIPEATYDWLWFVDADERVSPKTGELVRKLIDEHGSEFEAINIPFKSYFCGKWMQHCGWWPGYTMPRVLKRGFFQFAERIHGGVELNGREVRLAPDPALGIDHYSYETVHHYIDKLNRYTSTEAKQLAAEGRTWDWREAMAHMLHDLWVYYEVNPGRQDREHGWILSWLSGQYRWLSHAKLLDLVGPGTQSGQEPNAPVNLDDVLLFLEEELRSLRRQRPYLPLGIVWRSPLWDYSGYADEGRAFAKALAFGERDLSVQEIRWNDKRCEIPAYDEALLRALVGRRPAPSTIAITDCIPPVAAPERTATINILRTTFEVDRLPADWLPYIEAYDEVWVTSTFAARCFRQSGLAPERIRVVHPCIDTALYSPDGPRRPRPEVSKDSFQFLSVLEWQYRKGGDVLLESYTSAFSVDDGCELLLKVSCLHGQDQESVTRQADDFLQSRSTSLGQRPDIRFAFDVLEATQMAELYRGADVFVLPTRGEGWGRPYMEALACGVPVVATDASGQIDFLHKENALLVPATEIVVPEHAANEIPTYRGARWFEPDRDALVAAMRRSRSDSELRTKLRERGLADVAQRFTLNAGRAAVERAVTDCEKKLLTFLPRPVEPSQICVELDGEFCAEHSFSNVNEHLALGLSAVDSIALSLRRRVNNPMNDWQSPIAHLLRPYFGRPFEDGPQVVIRHSYPADLSPPLYGHWVHIQPWEYAHLPSEWLDALRHLVDEIWAPTQYVKRVYEQSGIPSHKIKVIPWGVDPDVFNPQAPRRILPREGAFRFLFVGGTIHRKGFDVLLKAYLDEFSADENVSLVVKDMGTNSVYRFNNFRREVLEASQDETKANIVYMDSAMTPGQLASLYTACDCLAMPYRGEGFGLPILEAMACGLAPIIPKGGASDDFTDETMAVYLPSREVETSFDLPLCGPALELEIDGTRLRTAMRWAYENRATLREMGDRAARHVAEHFTWARTISLMRERIEAIISKPPVREVTTGSGGKSAMRKLVAACLKATNAEAIIARRLAQLCPFVDEVIVVDGGSSDRTAAIGREYGARVVTREDSLSKEHVTADWMFWTGVDDSWDQSDLTAIKELAGSQSFHVDELKVKLAKSSIRDEQGKTHSRITVRRTSAALENPVQ